MTVLACAFGWTEEYILLWLPGDRGEQYYHGLLRRAGWRTYVPHPPRESQLAALAESQGIIEEAASAVDPDLEAALARFDLTP